MRTKTLDALNVLASLTAWCSVWLYDDRTGSELHDNTMHNDITDMKYMIYIYDIYMDKLFTPIWAHMMDVYINIVLPRPTPAHLLLYTIILSSVLSYKSSYISHDMSWYSYLYLLRIDPLLQKSWPVMQGLPHRMPQLFIYWIRVLRNLSPWYFFTIAGNFRPKDHRFHLRLGSVRAQYYWKVPWFSTKKHYVTSSRWFKQSDLFIPKRWTSPTTFKRVT